MPKISRNQPCPCGSGVKYKKCCGAAAPAADGLRPVLRPQERFGELTRADAGVACLEAETRNAEGPAASPGSQAAVGSRPALVVDGMVVSTLARRLPDRVAELAADVGLVPRVRKVSYSEHNATVELVFATVRDDGVVMDREAEAYLERAHDLGLCPIRLGDTFEAMGGTWRVAGLRPRARRSVICERLDGRDDPERCFVSPDFLRSAMGVETRQARSV